MQITADHIVFVNETKNKEWELLMQFILINKVSMTTNTNIVQINPIS